jgi:hypothetical protein
MSSRGLKVPFRIAGVLVTLCCGSTLPARAQVQTTEGLSLRDTILMLTSSQTGALGGRSLGDVVSFATALEVATTPLGTSSGSFVFTLDPTTGLDVRSATTFGPAFADRALTSGEGKVSIGSSFLFATYDKLGKLDLEEMPLLYGKDLATSDAALGVTSLALSSKTLVLSGLVGVTDALDLGVAVPLVTVKLDGISWVCVGKDPQLQWDLPCKGTGNYVFGRSVGNGVASGIGDIAVLAKYRFLKFGKELPDPGGLAALVTMRLPTGDTDNLRGLGINRTLLSLVGSYGLGKLQPHGNIGFEVWSRGVEVVADPLRNTTVNVRHQIQYNAGVEYEAAPKLTLLLDMLGRHTMGGGGVAFQTTDDPVSGLNLRYVVATDNTTLKLMMAPGLKLNLKGKLLVSLNALIPMAGKGLYDRFTPAVSLEWNF